MHKCWISAFSRKDLCWREMQVCVWGECKCIRIKPWPQLTPGPWAWGEAGLDWFVSLGGAWMWLRLPDGGVPPAPLGLVRLPRLAQSWDATCAQIKPLFNISFISIKEAICPHLLYSFVSFLSSLRVESCLSGSLRNAKRKIYLNFKWDLHSTF